MQVSGVSDDGAYTVFPLLPDVGAGGMFFHKEAKDRFLLKLFEDDTPFQQSQCPPIATPKGGHSYAF